MPAAADDDRPTFAACVDYSVADARHDAAVNKAGIIFSKARPAIGSKLNRAANAVSYKADDEVQRAGERSAQVVARLNERHRTLCTEVLSTGRPALARAEAVPALKT